MAEQELGRINELEVREVWRYEAQNFTIWLSKPENLELLGASLGLELGFVGREVPVGPYWLDILAQERGSGRYVAIENQLEWTDHGHLGQLLTYAAGRQAQILIWVAPRFTDQHREAINWLNQWTQREIDCYAVEVHVVQVDDSRPAPEFVPVAVPRNWVATNPRLTIPSRPSLEDSQMYFEFFQPLIDQLNEAGFTDETEAEPEYYQDFPSGVDELTYQVSFEEDCAWVTLWWWGAKTGRRWSNKVYDTLSAEMEQIKAYLGEELDGRRNGNTVGFSVSAWRYATISDSTPALEQIRAWMLEMLPKFRDVFNPLLERILAELETE